MNIFESLLTSHPYLLIDGAMGTMLIEAGLDSGKPPETWNISNPDQVQAVHRGYIEAGARVILTNSFGMYRVSRDSLDDSQSSLKSIINFKFRSLARK